MRLSVLLLFVTSFCYAQFPVVSTIGGSATPVPPPVQLDPNRARSVYTPDLEVPTYDADPNCTHGNYVYFDVAWNGYKYWMVFTPYPFEARENPSLVASNDGESWEVPPGITNPIDLLNTGDPYNSDPELIYNPDEDLLYVIYRKTYVSLDDQEVKYRTYDGVSVSAATIISSGVFQTESSFSFVYKDGFWHYWYVNTEGGGNADYEVYYKTAADIDDLDIASPTECTITSVPGGYHNWQFDIIYDEEIENYVGVMIFTIKQVGAPNTAGIASFMTSIDKTSWTVSTTHFPFPPTPAQYLLSIQKTDKSEKNGAAYELMHSVQWRIKNSLIWLTTEDPPVCDYDGITEIENTFSCYWRHSETHGLPSYRVIRASDSDVIDVFPDGSGGLRLASGVDLDTYEGASTLNVIRAYNQKGFTDYLNFAGTARPQLVKGAWNGTTEWTMVFDGVDDVGENYIGSQFDFIGITAPVQLTSGRFWTVRSGSNYMGMNSSNIWLLNGGNINTATTTIPYIYTGLHGASSTAKIRRNGSDIITGTTANPAANQRSAIGAHWATSVYSGFATCIIPEIVLWNTIPDGGDLSTVENKQSTDFPYTP